MSSRPLRTRSTLLLSTGILIALVTLLGATANAELRALRPGATSSRPEVTILSSTEDGTHLAMELPAVEIESIEGLSEAYQTVHFAESELMGNFGEPALPAFSRYVEIPGSRGVSLRVIGVETETLHGMRLLPMQDTDGDTFALDEEIYRRDEFLGSEAVSIGEPAMMRDLRVIPVTLRPVRDNPARGEVEILTRVEFELTYSGLDPRNQRPAREIPLTGDFDRLYRARVLNYDFDGSRSGQVAQHLGTWVLIYRDNNDVLTRLQPLIDWRRRMGFNVRVASTAETGTTANAIRTWLINAYNTWPDPPEYITLAGDATGTYNVPTFFENVSGCGGEGDHPYSQLSGTDNVPEAFVGRLSFGTLTQLETIVAKIMDYEKAPLMTDPTWFRSVCLVGDPNDSGFTCIQIQQWVKERLLHFFDYARVDTVFSGPWESKMRTSLNAGVTFYGYRGIQGMSGWSNGDVYALTNARKLPFAVNLTCGTGMFYDETSISEAWLQAGSTTNLIGGIGSIGTATTCTHTRYNNCYYGGVASGFWWHNLFRLGEAQTLGKLEMILNYGQWESAAATAYCYWNNLMGDPATDMWTHTPVLLTVSHPATVALGANVVTVSVENAATGDPVEGAWVYLYRADEIGMGGTTGADGSVDIPIDGSDPGAVLVTATGHNLYPYQGSLDIQQIDHFVGLDYATLDDGAAPPADGNGNGQPNPGEIIAPLIHLTNFGSATASDVTATLACADPCIDVVEAGPVSYGTINSGATAANPDGAFVFRVTPGTPNGHSFSFDLTVQSETYEWHSVLELSVVAADLNFATCALSGCGARLDPGESATMTVTIVNNGALSAPGPVHAQLISDSFSVDVTDGNGTYPVSLPPGGSAINSSDVFGISSPAGCVPGQLAGLRLALTFADGVHDTVPFTLVVGTADAQDPTGPDAYGYYAFDNADNGYAEKPTYSWIDIVGIGTFLGLTDYGDTQDDVVTVDLPFPFQYYGETFTRATICSNGWIAMGSTYLTDYRNWYMPCAGGPPNQIAVFWDDIYQTSSGKVYHWFDEANHRYVIAWDNVRMIRDYWQTYLESFELILYDPAYYPTYSGDGVIVFQYETVNNNDDLQHYCTVGIQNREHTDGLTYSYYHTEAATAATLQAGRAIKFTTAGPGASSAHSDGMQQPGLRLAMDSWPNPVREGTTIRFALDRERPVSLQIFNVDGRLVQTLVQGRLTAGEHRVEWPGTDAAGNLLPAGVYFYKLDSAEQSATRKLLILR